MIFQHEYALNWKKNCLKVNDHQGISYWFIDMHINRISQCEKGSFSLICLLLQGNSNISRSFAKGMIVQNKLVLLQAIVQAFYFTSFVIIVFMRVRTPFLKEISMTFPWIFPTISQKSMKFWNLDILVITEIIKNIASDYFSNFKNNMILYLNY